MVLDNRLPLAINTVCYNNVSSDKEVSAMHIVPSKSFMENIVLSDVHL